MSARNKPGFDAPPSDGAEDDEEGIFDQIAARWAAAPAGPRDPADEQFIREHSNPDAVIDGMCLARRSAVSGRPGRAGGMPRPIG